MAYLTLATETITGWNWSGSTAPVRVFASQSFYEATDGQFFAQGNPQQIQSFCAEYTATVSGTTVTLPEIVLASTTDSNVPNAVYTIILYDEANNNRFTLASQWFVDPEFYGAPADDISSTWEQFTLSNQGFGIVPNPTYPGPFWSVSQTKQYVNSVVGDGTTPFASSLVCGKTFLDVDPVTPSLPIAIGANSPSSGSGSLIRQTSPSIITANLGVPTAITLTHGTGLPVSSGISGLASGMATFLGSATSANLRATVSDESGTGSLCFNTNVVLVTPDLGTPSAAVLTHATGLPIATGVANLGTGIATFLTTPSSANLLAALTTKSGTGVVVFGTNPTISGATLTSPTLSFAVLGTPSSGTLTSCTGLPVLTGISGLGSGVATFLATPSSANLAAAVTNETGSGALVFANTCTLVTPVIGAATGTSLIATGLIKSSGSAGIGYSTGAGSTVNQGTSRTTTVVINKICGSIALFSAAGSATPFSFTVTNSTVAATDTIIVSQKSGTDKYSAVVSAVGTGSFEITVTDLTGTSTEVPVFLFSIIKAVTS